MQEISSQELLRNSHWGSTQVAKALQIGSETADELGFQYIVTMNEDAVPAELPEGFVFDDHVIPTHLTDATEDGGLFGIRFG